MKAIKLLILATIAMSTLVAANPGKRGDKGPPPEAYEACVNQAENDTVQITTRHGHTLEATCQIMDNELVAVPLNHKRRDNGE